MRGTLLLAEKGRMDISFIILCSVSGILYELFLLIDAWNLFIDSILLAWGRERKRSI